MEIKMNDRLIKAIKVSCPDGSKAVVNMYQEYITSPQDLDGRSEVFQGLTRYELAGSRHAVTHPSDGRYDVPALRITLTET